MSMTVFPTPALYWGLIIMLSTIFMYARSAVYLRRLSQSFSSVKAFQEFAIYPLIFLVSRSQCFVTDWILAFGSSCKGSSTNERIPSWLFHWLLVDSFLTRNQGFLNAWAYLKTRSIWKEIKSYFSSQNTSLIMLESVN